MLYIYRRQCLCFICYKVPKFGINYVIKDYWFCFKQRILRYNYSHIVSLSFLVRKYCGLSLLKWVYNSFTINYITSCFKLLITSLVCVYIIKYYKAVDFWRYLRDITPLFSLNVKSYNIGKHKELVCVIYRADNP